MSITSSLADVLEEAAIRSIASSYRSGTVRQWLVDSAKILLEELVRTSDPPSKDFIRFILSGIFDRHEDFNDEFITWFQAFVVTQRVRYLAELRAKLDKIQDTDSEDDIAGTSGIVDNLVKLIEKYKVES